MCVWLCIIHFSSTNDFFYFSFICFRLDNQQLIDLQRRHEEYIITIKEQYQNKEDAPQILNKQQILFLEQKFENELSINFEKFQKIMIDKKEENNQNEIKNNLFLISVKEEYELQICNLKTEKDSELIKIKCFNILKFFAIEKKHKTELKNLENFINAKNNAKITEIEKKIIHYQTELNVFQLQKDNEMLSMQDSNDTLLQISEEKLKRSFDQNIYFLKNQKDDEKLKSKIEILESCNESIQNNSHQLNDQINILTKKHEKTEFEKNEFLDFNMTVYNFFILLNKSLQFLLIVKSDNTGSNSSSK